MAGLRLLAPSGGSGSGPAAAGQRWHLPRYGGVDGAADLRRSAQVAGEGGLPRRGSGGEAGGAIPAGAGGAEAIEAIGEATSAADVEDMSVKDLQLQLRQAIVDASDCFDEGGCRRRGGCTAAMDKRKQKNGLNFFVGFPSVLPVMDTRDGSSKGGWTWIFLVLWLPHRSKAWVALGRDGSALSPSCWAAPPAGPVLRCAGWGGGAGGSRAGFGGQARGLACTPAAGVDVRGARGRPTEAQSTPAGQRGNVSRQTALPARDTRWRGPGIVGARSWTGPEPRPQVRQDAIFLIRIIDFFIDK
eukprot:CAMPEP_0118868746 /NCGR_PEP_ID=MMETSP1163-20130328/12225_1 /TAXON_ID=124430 /ORGANISM="Phaeomonas parva, Strain CCMP2877" /LENGTH=300 /DNA_ID=CAMNT_0006803507 /DNA_START=647 /DNA_END=1548 /DNA_ORIENTATION=+